MEKQLEQLEKKYPDNARGVAKFNVPLAHMIIAGADFLLVPSRFEPCGLIQLHAMRYGTVWAPPTNFSFHLLLQSSCLTCSWCNLNSSAGAHCCLDRWAGWYCQRRLYGIPDGKFQRWSKWYDLLLVQKPHSFLLILVWIELEVLTFGLSVWRCGSCRCDCSSNLCQEGPCNLWYPSFNRNGTKLHGSRSFLEGKQKKKTLLDEKRYMIKPYVPGNEFSYGTGTCQEVGRGAAEPGGSWQRTWNWWWRDCSSFKGKCCHSLRVNIICIINLNSFICRPSSAFLGGYSGWLLPRSYRTNKHSPPPTHSTPVWPGLVAWGALYTRKLYILEVYKSLSYGTTSLQLATNSS